MELCSGTNTLTFNVNVSILLARRKPSIWITVRKSLRIPKVNRARDGNGN